MILTKQLHVDFRNYVEGVKEEYTRKEKDYGWTYKCLFEELDDTEYFYFTNHFETIKICFIKSAKIIYVTTIYNKDLEIIKKLKEGL